MKHFLDERAPLTPVMTLCVDLGLMIFRDVLDFEGGF